MLEKVISGGQTGADQAGLHAARIYRIPTGGHCPKGWRTVFGTDLTLPGFNLIETPSNTYPPRTKRNVHNSDATVRLASNFDSPGERLTLRYCREAGKPVFDILLDRNQYFNKACALAEWINTNKIGVLNVAGNADRDVPFGFHFDHALHILKMVFQAYAK